MTTLAPTRPRRAPTAPRNQRESVAPTRPLRVCKTTRKGRGRAPARGIRERDRAHPRAASRDGRARMPDRRPAR